MSTDVDPEALRERAATPDDHPHFVRFFAQLGVDDPVPSREAWAASGMKHTFFLERAGAPVAYALAEPLADVGYVRHVVVAAEARGRGVGRALMASVARRLRAAGCAWWCLNVRPDNASAIALYERVGLARAYRSVALRIAWPDVARLPAPARRVTGRAARPDEDAALEDAFGLPRALLAAARERPGYHVLRLEDPGAPGDARVGVARFAPTYPGAFPFRVASPDLARPLFDAMRALVAPDAPWVQVVAEDDPTLERALLDAGATAKLETLHMRGQIPDTSNAPDTPDAGV